ncbi:anaphase-promoting complex subunit-like protein [Thermochaetoides thermophila DSM 1495]|uniref:Anaphase-promoting complex subunit 2 n=1 Tax=Chaetomium thermophilum (strain DSM 1495 / CBS 144.50 / IMI 039719) TaxID=759272 RepID=G0RZK6_CHATD|nr:anaphase-promoting complex subunit-like protein [Thermochaetoides thermophila DSM 1495]EGS23634.1 anaphase-promoting complex subunit-like protein [Thermochaetoides thermophila DSM 1495]
MPAAVASQWKDRRRRVFHSVFQTDFHQPSADLASNTSFLGFKQPFGGHQQQQQHHHRHHLHYGHLSLAPKEEQPEGRRPASVSSRRAAPGPSFQAQKQPQLHSGLLGSGTADDQATYDRAWSIVTASISLPSSAIAQGSLEPLTAESLQQSCPREDVNPEFFDAFALVVNASILLPGATRTADIVAWHVNQVRAHFAQHVIPLLSGCTIDPDDGDEEEAAGSLEHDIDGKRVTRRRKPAKKGSRYDKHLVIVRTCIRTLEAALRLYFQGMNQIISGFRRLAEDNVGVVNDGGELLNARFRRDIYALVSNSASEGLMRSVKVVLFHLVGVILGVPCPDEVGTLQDSRPAPPDPADPKVTAARERLLELVKQLHSVGLAGERFHVLFAEVMDAMMSSFVTGAYAGVWGGVDSRPLSASMDAISRSASLSASASRCISSLNDWVENCFARLSTEVLSCISPKSLNTSAASKATLQTYQSLALGRLAALRIQELFDIVLAWPASRGALDDLRATITTPARRKQLTDSFSHALQTRLLHPGCSTLDILRTYISIIRTLHALDPSKVLLSHVEPGLQLYLCQREDAIRVVVSGLLASPEEMRAARKAKSGTGKEKEKIPRTGEGKTGRRRADHGPFVTPTMPLPSQRTPGGDKRRRESTPEVIDATDSVKQEQNSKPAKLVELALLLNDPTQTRRVAPDADDDLDWNDMNWVPDPVDAGANYKRPKSEDVIGTLISALGSQDVFIKEFSTIVAERLLGEPTRFDQELRVLDLLKRRFGEAALQNCDVMIRDIQDSRRLDATINRARVHRRQVLVTPARGSGKRDAQDEGEMEYHARILSRLFWPNLDREHFLLPQPVIEQQKHYEQGYESLKSGRKLTWLNQLGQACVELELRDRTVTVDCSTLEATVIYAFQQEDQGEGSDSQVPVRKTVDELYERLQMDEDLITAALQFWVSQGVLRRTSGNQYVVVETLQEAEPEPETAPVGGEEPAAAEAAQGQPAVGVGAGLSAKERERREMYWRYVQGMLTNASATMPLAQIAMMLRMLIADGFPWSNEELGDFLSEKVSEGLLEIVGGKYRLVKK